MNPFLQGYRHSGPRDLREYVPGAGRIYEVDPEAVERFRRIVAEKEAAEATRKKALAIRSQAAKRRKAPPRAEMPAGDPAKELLVGNFLNGDKLRELHGRYMAGESMRVLAAEADIPWQQLMGEFNTAGLPKRGPKGHKKAPPPHTPPSKNGTTPEQPRMVVAAEPVRSVVDDQVRGIDRLLRELSGIEGVTVRGTVRIELEINI